MHIEVKLGLGAKAEALHGEVGRDTANTLPLAKINSPSNAL